MYYFCAAITLISAVVSLGFSVEAIIKGKENNKINALYTSSRSVALLCVSIVPIFIFSKEIMIVTSVGMIIVQFLDGFVGIKIRNTFKTLGPFITAIVNCIVLVLFL